MTYMLTVCVNGQKKGPNFDAVEETIEAVGEAIAAFEETEGVISILLEEIPGSVPERPPITLTDAEALDKLNLLVSAAEWPGASGMEDVCQIVRNTGRQEIPNAPEWYRH